MQNTSVTDVSMGEATLCPNVTWAARLCSRVAICRLDPGNGELRNEFKCIDGLIKRVSYLARASAGEPWLSRRH